MRGPHFAPTMAQRPEEELLLSLPTGGHGELREDPMTVEAAPLSAVRGGTGLQASDLAPSMVDSADLRAFDAAASLDMHHEFEFHQASWEPERAYDPMRYEASGTTHLVPAHTNAVAMGPEVVQMAAQIPDRAAGPSHNGSPVV